MTKTLIILLQKWLESLIAGAWFGRFLLGHILPLSHFMN